MKNYIASCKRPARYLGGEVLSIVKDPAKIRLKLALAFPEIYEIAMSNLGIKILYESLASRPEVSAERVFAPWVDLMDQMYIHRLSPWSLETGRELKKFDVIGFFLHYELTYINFLHMLRLADIPIKHKDRTIEDPLVIAGGPCLVNPEPIADFLDFAIVGEAEELIYPLVDLLIKFKEEHWERNKLYREVIQFEGVYVPALFMPIYKDGRLIEIKSLYSGYSKVRRRIVMDLNKYVPPIKQIVPVVQPIHDRLVLEVVRGCTRGCRFCQAGYIYRPVRERDPQVLLKAALSSIAATGIEEVGLLSLSIGDYTCIEFLMTALMNILEEMKIGLSLPSLRIDSFSSKLAAQIKRVRKTGFTLAPEAGTQRLRQIINKDLTNNQILSAANAVFALGWKLIKLYFMVGLPGENTEDIRAIGDLCKLIAGSVSSYRRKSNSHLINASIGIFVPKPHTPFQWERQINLKESIRRLALVKKSCIDDHRIKVKLNLPEQSLLEGILSRGDRRLSRVLEFALDEGCCFDGWSEKINIAGWLAAMAKAGLTLEEYLRPREINEVLPWDHIDIKVDKSFLLTEYYYAQSKKNTYDCRWNKCNNCGVCDFNFIKPVIVESKTNCKEIINYELSHTIDDDKWQIFHFRLKKIGLARFLSHLDMIKQIQRAFRRVGVKIAYSQGFHPHPMFKTGSALPLGIESLVEKIEVTLSLGKLSIEQLCERLNKTLPKGIKLTNAYLVRPGEKFIEPEVDIYLIRSQVPFKHERLEWFNQIDSVNLVRESPKGQRKIDFKVSIKDIKIKKHSLILVINRFGIRPRPTEVLEVIFRLTAREILASRIIKVA